MASERIQRRIERLLDQAEEAADKEEWQQAAARAREVLTLDERNQDALALLTSAGRMSGSPVTASSAPDDDAPNTADVEPTAFANGRYEVRRFLGEGGKKKVYLAHDLELDRDVAFALIKTEGLDEAARTRVTREAQAMGRLGSHPHIVTVYDIGEESGQPYLVLPVLPGGDVEGVIEKAEEHRLPIEQAVKIASETCLGLEFAHSKGIIHRDLKPGNVWLAEDGRAMIGDFGLAVAVDRSRLTQAGMMVGTVNYMPPEQAMGGEVTPQSDLYSLGCMLYEMVCGRPPFVGDESVAIIGQHLNTPPVAPTWHRPDCPPGLEALILRLLEKDASKRPASASEVREALSSIGATPSAPSIHEEVTVPHEHDPLYRRVFVGREQELRQLQQAYDAAMSGQGGLVMVVGEPGIGKTALCEQLATYVSIRGGRTLIGHCYEEGSLSLPYLAFVEAMRTYVLARDPEGLRGDLGTGAADVARIVSEVRDRVQVELPAASSPEDDRWRLLQSVTTFLGNAANVQPLVIVLEDLHWADRGTLDLLQHVTRNLQGARLLVVGTYRDVEVDRTHPLSASLADLRRLTTFTRVPLRGLTVDEVHRMYEAIRGNDVPWGQAEEVYRATEGNPLFVQEVLRYLVEEGFVVREDGRYVAQQGVGAGIPDGLRDVVGKRLSRLSDSCNRLLSVAAVIGRDFDLETLRRVADLGEEELLSGIEEAVRVGVLEERAVPGSLLYRFSHAFFRQTLYEEMIAARRLRLHQEIARALEAQYESRREEHAAELAEHFGQSTDRADLAKAVEYSELAARRGMQVFAYAEAESHLKRCLEVQHVLDPGDSLKRCDLLIALGESKLPQSHPETAIEQAAEPAFELAEAAFDRHRAAQACHLAAEALLRGPSPGIEPGTRGKAFEKWALRASECAEPDTIDKVYADAYLGQSHFFVVPRRPAEGQDCIRRALEQARTFDDNRLFILTARLGLQHLRAVKDVDTLDRLAIESLARPRAGLSTRDLGRFLLDLGERLLEMGDRENGERVWQEQAQLAERSGDVALLNWNEFPRTQLAFHDGRLAEAAEISEAARNFAESLGVGVNTVREGLLLYYLGRSVQPYLDYLKSRTHVRGLDAVTALTLCYAGQTAEVPEIRARFQGIDSDGDPSATWILELLLATIPFVPDEAIGSALVRRLTPLAHRLTVQVGVSVGRLLAEAVITLGRWQEARDFYDQALAVSEKVRFRPEVALIHLGLADLLLDHYPDEHDAAIEHLDFAIAEFRDMKMQPALERALGRRGLLKA